MKNSLVPIMLVSCWTLAGCATSQGRWVTLQGSASFAAWSRCVDDEAQRLLNEDSAADNLQQKFVSVIANCKSSMSGPDWQFMKDSQFRLMMNDAQRRFLNEAAEIAYRRDLETI